jgi:hypothetical protein
MINKILFKGVKVVILEDYKQCAWCMKNIIDRMYDETLPKKERIFNK